MSLIHTQTNGPEMVSLGADGIKSLSPAKWSYPKHCKKDMGKMGNRQLKI